MLSLDLYSQVLLRGTPPNAWNQTIFKVLANKGEGRIGNGLPAHSQYQIVQSFCRKVLQGRCMEEYLLSANVFFRQNFVFMVNVSFSHSWKPISATYISIPKIPTSISLINSSRFFPPTFFLSVLPTCFQSPRRLTPGGSPKHARTVGRDRRVWRLRTIEQTRERRRQSDKQGDGRKRTKFVVGCQVSNKVSTFRTPTAPNLQTQHYKFAARSCNKLRASTFRKRASSKA